MVRRVSQRLVAFGFIGPAVFYLLALSLVPLGYSLWLAFHRWSIMARMTPPYVGFQNFIQLLADNRLWYSFRITAIFGVSTLALEIILGLGIALLLNRNDLRGLRLIRSLVILPIIMAPLAVGYTFRLMYHSTVGPFNYLLSTLGLPTIEWLSHPTASLAALILATLWQWTPFSALVILAGLHSIPMELVEEAKVDGASWAQLLRYVQLPLLRPVILIVLLIRVMEVFKLFDMVFVLTGGGPGSATEMVSLYTYKVGFGAFDLSYAAAVSYLLLAIIVILSQIFIRFVSPWRASEGV